MSNQPSIESKLKRLAISVVTIAGACQSVHAEAIYAILDDAIIVRAREAREAENGNAMFLQGGLELRAPEWRIDAIRGDIYGKLEDPDRIVADGNPARISVSRSQDGEIFDGRGQHIEFEPNGRTVKLEGEAVVVKGRQSIRSRSIEYRLDEDKFYAGDDGRVRVVTTPKSDAS